MIPSDTSLDAERVQRQLLRRKSASERAGMTFRLSSQLIRAGKRAIARTDSRLANWQIGDRFVELHYGQKVRREKLEPASEIMESTSEILQALRPVVDELDRLGVRYYIGGSVASSIHGAVRSTIDVDISGELDEDTALAFASAGPDYS